MEINLTTIKRLTNWRTICSDSDDPKPSNEATTSQLHNILRGIEETLYNSPNTVSDIERNLTSVRIESDDHKYGQQKDRGPLTVCHSDEWGFLSLFVEAARNNQTQEDLDIFLLETIGIKEKSTRQHICECYGRLQPRLSRQLVQLGSHLKHVVDVKCRMDYQVTNTINGRTCDGDPTYLVKLICQHPNKPEVEHINLSCTLFELQDLVNQLKDARRMCERSSAVDNRRNEKTILGL